MPHGCSLGASCSIDDLLLYRINRLLGVAGGMVIRLCEGRFGITRREWRIIALLAQGEGLLSSQLAKRAQLDRARTSKAITSLVAKKLLRRATGPADRRQALVTLTDKGRTIYAALFPQVQQLNGELLAVLDAAEILRLDSMLERLQHRADEIAAQAALPKADRGRGARARQALG